MYLQATPGMAEGRFVIRATGIVCVRNGKRPVIRQNYFLSHHWPLHEHLSVHPGLVSLVCTVILNSITVLLVQPS